MAQDIETRRKSASRSGPRLDLIETTGFPDYALVDSGGGRKLERFGTIVVDRPEPQAMWTPRQPERVWRTANDGAAASMARR